MYTLKDKIQDIIITDNDIAILYGNGFNDDTKALQLILNGTYEELKFL